MDEQVPDHVTGALRFQLGQPNLSFDAGWTAEGQVVARNGVRDAVAQPDQGGPGDPGEDRDPGNPAEDGASAEDGEPGAPAEEGAPIEDGGPGDPAELGDALLS